MRSNISVYSINQIKVYNDKFPQIVWYVFPMGIWFKLHIKLTWIEDSSEFFEHLLSDVRPYTGVIISRERGSVLPRSFYLLLARSTKLFKELY